MSSSWSFKSLSCRVLPFKSLCQFKSWPLKALTNSFFTSKCLLTSWSSIVENMAPWIRRLVWKSFRLGSCFYVSSFCQFDLRSPSGIRRCDSAIRQRLLRNFKLKPPETLSQSLRQTTLKKEICSCLTSLFKMSSKSHPWSTNVISRAGILSKIDKYLKNSENLRKTDDSGEVFAFLRCKSPSFEVKKPESIAVLVFFKFLSIWLPTQAQMKALIQGWLSRITQSQRGSYRIRIFHLQFH